jgi:hypothetical protein
MKIGKLKIDISNAIYNKWSVYDITGKNFVESHYINGVLVKRKLTLRYKPYNIPSIWFKMGEGDDKSLKTLIRKHLINNIIYEL